MSSIQIHQFPCLDDNYGYLVHVAEAGLTAAIDTPDAAAYERELAAKGWALTHILNTHWHPDHAGGNSALQAKWGCAIIAPADDKGRIPGADRYVDEGETVSLGPVEAKILSVPGHTTDHVAYWFESEGVAFVGDALFALGCGRLFEGSPDMMWTSLSKLNALPAETIVYCAHEYTAANAAFAVTVDPGNVDLARRSQDIARLRAEGRPTVPTSIGLEQATNPFLRPHDREIRAGLGLESADDVTVFAEIRRRKDVFRG